MSEPTYTDRRTEPKTIKSVEGGTLTFTDGWCFGGVPREVLPVLRPGGEFLLESRGISLVTGMATFHYGDSGEPVINHWLWHKSDAELAREHTEMVASQQGEHEARLDIHREDWARREALLPEPLRRRLERFRATGGDYFEREGWAYELIVCELAVLYAASGQTESAEVRAYDERAGCSGNQHGYACALSTLLTGEPADDEKIVNANAAITPFTGDPDYSRGP